MNRLAFRPRLAPVVVPSVVALRRGTTPVNLSEHVVGGSNQILARRPIVGRGTEAAQQADPWVVEDARHFLVRGSVEVCVKCQTCAGSDDRVV